MPEFIIAGAMKSGTTSLHHVLAHDPRIFIPFEEIHFYDIDDLVQHPDFFFFDGTRWFYPNLTDRLEAYLDWYESFFTKAGADQHIGEDSTIYLASSKAAERISRLNPDAKIIIIMRDPASRTYSHYWHLVNSGRAIWDFESSLQVMPENLIQRSLYKQQIENFLKFIPREKIHFIVFEEFIKDMETSLKEVYRFLEISFDGVDLAQIDTHRGSAMSPKKLNLQLWRNRILRLKAKHTYHNHLVEVPDEQNASTGMAVRSLDFLHRKFNPLQPVRPPKMKKETRDFLNYYFSGENRGISELIGVNVDEYWYRS